jgi:hypothetical protein
MQVRWLHHVMLPGHRLNGLFVLSGLVAVLDL